MTSETEAKTEAGIKPLIGDLDALIQEVMVETVAVLMLAGLGSLGEIPDTTLNRISRELGKAINNVIIAAEAGKFAVEG